MPTRPVVRLLAGLAVGLPLALCAVLGVNTATNASRQVDADAAPVPLDAPALAKTLSGAVKIPTVAHSADNVDLDAIEALLVYLEEQFPLAHSKLQRQRIGRSVLYEWKGSVPTLEPALWMAHMDVVPVDDVSRWEVDPYSGAIQDGFVWGRGTLDDKQNVVGQLAAIEYLLSKNFQPKRTLLLAYGHDEEVGGSGAIGIAKHLATQGTHLALVLDEGGALVDGVLDGLEQPGALIGVSEKGFLSVELLMEGTGGHSSMPPKHTAVGVLAEAITKLENNPMPARISGPTAAMFDNLGPELTFPMSVVMANRWLLDPVVVMTMSKKDKANALLRTTTAATMFEGSIKENVLPQKARAVVNFRIHPDDSIAGVLEHVRTTIDNPEIKVSETGDISSEPSPVSQHEDDPMFAAVSRSVRQIWPEAKVAPYLVVGATDARHYAALSDHVYRFSPVLVNSLDLGRIHGTDERIGVEGFAELVGFYVRLAEGLQNESL